MTHHDLDNAITDALKKLTQPTSTSNFDYQKYIAAFRDSAQKKAAATLVELTSPKSPFRDLRPVFVSIGGGDGEELINLLRQSRAGHGILVEHSTSLADAARRRSYEVHPKKLLILEGDAQERLPDAIREAEQFAKSGQADFLAVTCHAVLHELFDRGKAAFDPLAFFGTIFSTNLSTWFTYREPGVPEKWPEQVLLKARCAAKSLLALAEAIRSRHQVLDSLAPKPIIVGDHVRLHKTLAMEVLAKLFYLQDIEHEIHERSTAVEHTLLQATLLLAIGDTARQENRAQVRTVSAPTDAFVECWERFGVEVQGLDPENRTIDLAIAESQTRVVAWRQPASDTAFSEGTLATIPSAELLRLELSVARDAFQRGDADLTTALIESRGRSWIESTAAVEALTFLREVCSAFPQTSKAHIWSHYNLCLARLFAGDRVSPEWFSREVEDAAAAYGLALLIRAERMEFSRRSGSLVEALNIANDLRSELTSVEARRGEAVASYVLGTAHFVLGNLLRHGGQYDLAWEHVNRAQSLYIPGLLAHDTELAHCYYAKQVCIAVTGKSTFDAPFGPDADSANRRFASALITLCYSHAAWFVGDVCKAKVLASDAANRFAAIGLKHYAARSQNLARLLSVWQALLNQTEPDFCFLRPDLTKLLQILIGYESDEKWLVENLCALRPSTAIGLLQFYRQFKKRELVIEELRLPETITVRDDGQLAWRLGQPFRSLDEGERELRKALAIPADLRVPLMAD